MDPPVIQRLKGERLHLSHGPIDVVLRAWGRPEAVRAAEAAAAAVFPGILPGLAGELAELRRPIADGPRACHPVARRMVAACAPFAPRFVTPMAAVAGAVADELLAAMLRAAPLLRAYVNDGGDIAVHVAPGQVLDIGLVADPAGLALDGALRITEESGIGGVATSGRAGRSFSLGIADSVSVLARDAAVADVAATLIANAVDIASPSISRVPARSLDPDSDLGERLVSVEVGPLSATDIAAALSAGALVAEGFVRAGLVLGAALRLRGVARVVGIAGARLAP